MDYLLGLMKTAGKLREEKCYTTPDNPRSKMYEKYLLNDISFFKGEDNIEYYYKLYKNYVPLS